ncbi:MAG: 16S rRNA (cytidine(1402)-2'-O)-methyltransferase [Herpetosiphon sp.]|nr:16S rRNA (cytidine(1402)-2'-O)-methyltransferase [Herpetosiphon sp.]
MTTLYLVATPIGNLEDITARALRILSEVKLIAAEDTRHTRKLLNRYEIETQVISYHEHNKLARLDMILLTLANGGDVALVSDAGTPAISDPGYELVHAVINAGFPVSPIPGACAAIAGLIGSGLSTEQFFYCEFAPRRSSERQAWFQAVAAIHATLVCYEAPHRIEATLKDALAVLGNRQAAVARELTKLHEQFVRGTLQDLIDYFAVNQARGEIVLVIAGAPKADPIRRRIKHELSDEQHQTSEQPNVDEATIRHALQTLRDQGMNGSKAAKQVAQQFGVNRQEVYRIWTELA